MSPVTHIKDMSPVIHISFTTLSYTCPLRQGHVSQNKPPATAAQTSYRRNRNSRCRARAGQLTNSQLQVSGIKRHRESQPLVTWCVSIARVSLAVNQTCCQSNLLSILCITCFVSFTLHHLLCRVTCCVECLPSVSSEQVMHSK